MATKKQTPPHLSLHVLLGELSFWGSATRVLLITFLAFAILLIRTLEVQASSDATLTQTLMTEGQLFVYAVGSFLLLDVGYVTMSRSYVFSKLKDTLVLIGSEIILAIVYFLPYLVVLSDKFVALSRWIFVAVLLVLSARLLIGILYGKTPRK